jgi:hypothetical protein
VFDSFTNSASPGIRLAPTVRPSLSIILNLTSPNIDGYSIALESLTFPACTVPSASVSVPFVCKDAPVKPTPTAYPTSIAPDIVGTSKKGNAANTPKYFFKILVIFRT